MNVLSQGGYQFYVLCCFLVVFLRLYIFMFCTFYSIHLFALYVFLFYTSSCSIHLFILYIFLYYTSSYSIHLLILYIFLFYTSFYSIHLLILYIFLYFIFYFIFLRHVQHLLYLQLSTYLNEFWLILCQLRLGYVSLCPVHVPWGSSRSSGCYPHR